MQIDKYKLFFSNNEPKTSIKFNKNKSIIKNLEILYEQAIYLFNCYNISERLYIHLSRKFNKLDTKWYIYAYNSINDNIILLSSKLLGKQKDEYSFYNILEYLSFNNNAQTIMGNKKNELNDIFEEFNKKILPIFSQLTTRRNKWQAHISERIFKKNFETDISIKTGLYEIVLYFCLKQIRKLYKFISNQDLKPSTDLGYLDDITKFVNLLDEKGDLNNSFCCSF